MTFASCSPLQRPAARGTGFETIALFLGGSRGEHFSDVCQVPGFDPRLRPTEYFLSLSLKSRDAAPNEDIKVGVLIAEVDFFFYPCGNVGRER